MWIHFCFYIITNGIYNITSNKLSLNNNIFQRNVFNAEGKLSTVHQGPISQETLDKSIMELLDA